MARVEWDYFDKFEELTDKYMPMRGEGETKASQIVTAVNKLVYKWYNDGDVFDNTYILKGWWNDLSSYANWLYEHTDADRILVKITSCYNEEDYENLLKELADKLLDAEYLEKMDKEKKIETIYECNGVFEYKDTLDDEDEEEDYYDDEEDWEEEEEY